MSLKEAKQVFTTTFPHPFEWNEQYETYEARAMCDFWTQMSKALGIYPDSTQKDAEK